jgi:carboxypeptidase family protein
MSVGSSQRQCWLCLAALVVLTTALSGSAFAQGGGASTTGTVQGRVADTSGAVLPGVTVIATSPSMISAQSQTTTENGAYRFPAVPPGTYTLTFELAGFRTIKREGIQVALGFTATVNEEMSVASIAETVTVTGQSPVIDTAATRVQQNFKLEQLQSIPNGRDMWALLAATPGVAMSRIDVGGNRAGTQTGYTAYGLNGQVRTAVEGINTTEGTGGAGFYYDYGSFEEVFLGVAGQGAEAATPGVQSQFLGKSGGNTFTGEFYVDGYTNSMQGENLSSETINTFGVRPHSNEVQKYYDYNVNIGGPIKRNKAWFHYAYRKQFNAVGQPQFTFDKTFDTWNTNPSAKVTYQATSNNKLIAYYQWNAKTQPNRLPLGTYTYDNPGQTVKQYSPSWVWKGEWNSTLSNKLFVEARYGVFGYYDPRIPNSDVDYYWRDSGTLTLTGVATRNQTDRERKQATGSATYFLEKGRGSHTFKFGGEIYKETQWDGNQGPGGNIEHIYSNGRASQVIFYVPTALHIGNMGEAGAGNLLVINKLDQQDLFVSDTWALGRLTMTLGTRWDRYRGWMPEQRQIAYQIGPVSVPEQIFPDRTFYVWNSMAPRLGIIYDVNGNGRTIVKASYGLFWENPGPGLSSGANPNQATKTVTYNWTDTNGDRRFQLGEQGAQTASSLANAIGLDSSIAQPKAQDVTLYLERQIGQTIGTRVGYVYKTEDNLFAQYRPGRPIESYTVPFSFVDIGPDGRSGTSDDRTLTLYGFPTALQSQYPNDLVVMNTPRFSRYKTVEASMSKRTGGRWAMQAGGSYTWAHDFPGAYPNDPNGTFDEDTSRWDFKLSGTYEAPLALRISPLLRHQAGVNFARQISVGSSFAAAVGAIYSGTINAEPLNSRRQDNPTVLDVRVERAFTLYRRLRARGFLDLFNITNSDAAETRTITTGSSFLRPTAILAPRTLRLGTRVTW